MSELNCKMIYFFGPDGTGKTTHAEHVASYLRRKGCRVWRTGVKHHHTLAYLLLKLLSGKNPDGLPLSYYGFNDELKQKIRTPWKMLELISLLPAIFYRVLLPQLLGYIVICDRYLLDTLVTLSYFLNDQELITGTYARLLTLMIPKHAVLFYMNANTETILQRKKDEPLTSKLVEYYKLAYQIIIRQVKLKVVTIDTSNAKIEDVKNLVLQHIIEHCSIAEQPR
ncbi:MAG: hypothetical protein ACPLSM_00085 [Thermosphaera sp.]